MMTYSLSVSIQLTIYEIMMSWFRNSKGPKMSEYEQIAIGSLVSAGVSSVLTNPMEVFTVGKQIDPRSDVREVIRKEGARLLTKGIGPRTVYNCLYSLLFFNSAHLFGKAFDVSLTEE